ncbi:MAG: PepSY domain-containing protein [Gemmatimonadaceae bacterium]|nr:PepSY domain-containing protein [Gemmatimonadaceae bacterium]
MKKSGLLVVVAFVVPALASAQAGGKASAKTSRKADTEATLRAEARIDEATARRIALKQVKRGTVKSSELEREKGHLVYSFDIKVAAQSGIEEVLIDAMNGNVISREHETPKMEKAEARKDAKEKASASKKR